MRYEERKALEMLKRLAEVFGRAVESEGTWFGGEDEYRDAVALLKERGVYIEEIA